MDVFRGGESTHAPNGGMATNVYQTCILLHWWLTLSYRVTSPGFWAPSWPYWSRSWLILIKKSVYAPATFAMGCNQSVFIYNVQPTFDDVTVTSRSCVRGMWSYDLLTGSCQRIKHWVEYSFLFIASTNIEIHTLFTLGQCPHYLKSAKFADRVIIEVQLTKTTGVHHQPTACRADVLLPHSLYITVRYNSV